MSRPPHIFFKMKLRDYLGSVLALTISCGFSEDIPQEIPQEKAISECVFEKLVEREYPLTVSHDDKIFLASVIDLNGDMNQTGYTTGDDLFLDGSNTPELCSG